MSNLTSVRCVGCFVGPIDVNRFVPNADAMLQIKFSIICFK